MEILQITLAILSLFYGFFCFIGIFRLVKIFAQKRVYKISYSFYIAMIFSSLARAGTFLMIMFEAVKEYIHEDKNKKIEYLILTIPDMVYVCVFLTLIWHCLTQYIISHINVANDLNVFMNEDVPGMKKKTNYVLYGVIPAYIIAFIVISIVYYFVPVNDNTTILKIEGSISIVTPFIFLGYYIFINVKFSGRPYKRKKEDTVNHVLFVSALWSCERAGIGIFNIVIALVNYEFMQWISSTENSWSSLGVVGFFIITEFVPLYFALDFGMMKTFIKRESTAPLNSSIDDSEADSKVALFVSNDSESKISARASSKANIQNALITNSSDIELIDEMFSKKNGLGKIYSAKYKGEDVCCRVVLFERLSRYDLEGIYTDLKNLVNLSNPNISPLVGLLIEENTKICIVSPFYANGSLYDYIHENENEITFIDKLKLAIGIAKGLKYLNDNQIPHLHLSSRNIYLEDDMTPVIADFGFDNLKEIASIFNKYTNKNSYSPPEILIDAQTIGRPLGGDNESIDVYSFGMVLWEIVTSTIPFNLKISEVIDYVVEQKMRPEITKDVDRDIAELIRMCWESENKNRPKFDAIIDILNKKIS